MAVVAGIDEAGFGPLLGPLVVSSACFRVPDELIKSDLWGILGRAVAKHRQHQIGRLLITDSKKAYTRTSGIVQLQRSVLACAGCACGQWGRCQTALDALRTLCPDCFGRLSDYPWYEDLGAHALEADHADIELAGKVLLKAMDDNDMVLLGLRGRCLDVGQYNRLVDAVRNKSAVLFTELCTLIAGHLNELPEGEVLQVIVDRQGGRINYRGELARMFPQMQMKVLKQDTLSSSYELTGGGKAMKVHFTVKADLRFLPVALASMASKYVREILVDAMNRYFQKHCATLKPTAGYWQDGQRFIRDLETRLPELKLDLAKLIRNR